MHVLYNVVDMALINSRIVYKSMTKSSISKKHFIQEVCKKLTQNTPFDSNKTPLTTIPKPNYT